MLARVLTLAMKEFLALLKDPKSRFVIIAPPIFQMLVFGYAATYDLNHVPLAVWDEDRSAASRELLAGFAGSKTFEQVARVGTPDELAEAIDSRRVLLAVHVGPDFSRKLARGQTAPVQIIIDGRDSNTALVALGHVRQIAADFSLRWARAHQMPGPPARLVATAWFNANLESRWFIVPGIVALMTLVVTMLVTSLSVAREREQGTFEQLLVTPLRPGEILLAKALPGMVIGLADASAVIAIAHFWFRVPLEGHPLTLLAGMLTFLLSAVGVGLMISSLARTMQQALLGAFLFLVPAVILSGFTTPIANMPPAVQYLTYLNPMRYIMVVLRQVFLAGATLESLLGEFWPMALIGLATLPVAGWMFRRRMN